jgi:uncharacterized protein (DUF58 family)
MSDYFDPNIIGRIKGLSLRSQHLVESLMVGMHKSRLRGISTEFAQHRQYADGDDTRRLDWKVFARTNRLYLKEYEAETSMPVRFLLDTSRSMFFKSDRAAMSKFDYAATVVATLCYLLMQQKDTFGLALFSQKVLATLPPKGSRSHFRNIVDVLSAASAQGETDLSSAVTSIAAQCKQRGLVVIVSDLLSETDSLALALGQLSFLGQDAILFHVEDPVERDFPFSGPTVFLGPEQEGKLLCEPRDFRNLYLAERGRHLDAIRDACRRFGYDVEAMPTDAHLDAVLSGFLSLRQVKRMVR